MVEEAAGVGEGKENGGAIKPWVGLFMLVSKMKTYDMYRDHRESICCR